MLRHMLLILGPYFEKHWQKDFRPLSQGSQTQEIQQVMSTRDMCHGERQVEAVGVLTQGGPVHSYGAGAAQPQPTFNL